MKRIVTLFVAGTLLVVTGTFSSAQKPVKAPEAAPIIIRATAHTAHFNDFQVRRSKDRSLEWEIKKKGLDLAFTEWMQRDHPYVFAAECVKHAGDLATEFKSTNHMLDFDKLIEKRSDLRLQASKYGHDIAFAEWLRTERPDVYREHFGIKPTPAKSIRGGKPAGKGDAPGK